MRNAPAMSSTKHVHSKCVNPGSALSPGEIQRRRTAVTKSRAFDAGCCVCAVRDTGGEAATSPGTLTAPGLRFCGPHPLRRIRNGGTLRECLNTTTARKEQSNRGQRGVETELACGVAGREGGTIFELVRIRSNSPIRANREAECRERTRSEIQLDWGHLAVLIDNQSFTHLTIGLKARSPARACPGWGMRDHASW
jgi:hypothetical protein